MNDGFNEDAQEIATEVLNQQQKDIKTKRSFQEQDIFMENIYDLHKFTTDPALAKRYPNLDEIDKNWVLGNYKPKHEQILLMLESLMDDVDFVLPNGTKNDLIRSSLIREQQALIAATRGSNGFAAKLLVTQIGSTKAEITGLDAKKKKSLFGGFGKKE